MNRTDASTSNPDMPRRSRIGGMIAGSIVILIGLLFLADNFGISLPVFGWHNWWALFMLIGAAEPAARAIDRYRSVGSVDSRVAHAMVSTLGIVAIALGFLLDVSFAKWWPIFLVIGGLSMFVSGGKGRDNG